MAELVGGISDDGSPRKEALPLGHYIRHSLTRFRQRIRPVGKQTARLGLWLEMEVFPSAKRAGHEAVGLDVLPHGEIRLKETRNVRAAVSLDDCQELCAFLEHLAIHRLKLDTRLESNQVQDVLTLLYAYRRELALNREDGETTAGMGGHLRSDRGAHVSCAKLRLQGHLLVVEYSYCVTRLSLAVRWFEGRHRHFNDHRALFRAAPRYGALAAAMVVAILLIHVFTDSLPLLIGMTLLQAVILFAAVYVFLRGMGSIEYDNEEKAYRLGRAHAALERYADRIRNDLALASAVQQKLLPDRRHMPQTDRLEWASSFVPETEVGGDYFDAAELGKGKVAMVFADVSGHGTAAALITVIVKMAFRAWVEVQLPLTDFVRRVNRDLWRFTPDERFVVLVAAVLDDTMGRLDYVNCGHAPQPFFVPSDPSRPITSLTRTGAMLLGVEEEIEVDEATQPLVRGDRILLATDGLTEAADSQGRFYGKERLSEFLQAHRSMNLEELVAALTEDVARFSAETEQSDDRTVLAFQVR
ncbi:MAG: SpoIIE family protein phosphatase [Phycisphaerae bacterium]|nr:SpoIIE family protein phosphatase [Phycisphaerae bacterium]